MPMSDDEQRKLQELEAEVAEQRDLVKLARQLSSATVYTGRRRVTAVWTTGGSIGLILVIIGAVLHSSALLAVAVVVLAGTMLGVGGAAIGVEIPGYRREHRSNGQRPHSP